ncbi:MAG: hypothetical protein ACE5G0_06080 [Rhodothermales bacterium]
MNARTKSIFLLFATLVVGLLVGGFATSALHNQRLERIRNLSSRGGFIDMMDEVIQPTSETQRTQIHAVLERSEARFSEARNECRVRYAAARDSMRAELAPLLTADQQTRFEEWLARDRRPRRNHRGRDRKPSKQRNGSFPR